MSNFFDRNNYYYQENQRLKEDAKRKELSDYARRAAINGANAAESRSIDYYRQLLSKPMEEIAAANGDFKATFEKQQEIIADWIVSQKAFRELAYEFGEKLGLSEDEVRAQVKDKKKDVLNDTTKYGNNASSSINQFELSESTIQKQKEKAGM